MGCRDPRVAGGRCTLDTTVREHCDIVQLMLCTCKQPWVVIDNDDCFQYGYGLRMY